MLNIIIIFHEFSLDYRWYITTTSDEEKIQTKLTIKSELSGGIIYPDLEWELQLGWQYIHNCNTTLEYDGFEWHLPKGRPCVFPFKLEDGNTYYGCNTKWRVCNI